MRPAAVTLKVATANDLNMRSYLSAADSNVHTSIKNAHANSVNPSAAKALVKPYLVSETHCNKEAKPLYQCLTRAMPKDEHVAEARAYLEDKLALVEPMSSDFPISLEHMEEWLQLNNHRVRVLYQRYLTARQHGAPRRLFSTKSHALNFLQAVAPTKLVDGAWLYGLVNLWQDPRFSNLIKIYLEELGDGNPGQNHVVLYKKLLAEHDCEQWSALPDEYFTQGMIQLALGLHAEDFIPEVIGFNLGYEQLPLHLLITAYELKELGIDPYYFTLHVTIDNVDTGHARRSLEALFDAMPVNSESEQQAFLRRVCNGYKLNQIGLSTNSIIAKYDLNNEVLAIFKAKSHFGKQAHADRCRIAGRTINDWLSEPDTMPKFLAALIDNGWFNKHATPEQSRFWKLIDGDQAKMFGVFSGYEKQVIYDWMVANQASPINHKPTPVKHLTHEQILLNKIAKSANIDADDDFNDAEIHALEMQIVSMDSISAIMKLLSRYLSPVLHHTPAGLLATRLYRSMIYKTHDVYTRPATQALNAGQAFSTASVKHPICDF